MTPGAPGSPASPVRKLSTSGADAGHPLAAWLATRLRLSAAEARALVTGGSVYVDGRRVRDPERPLAAAQRIAVHLAKAPTASAPAPVSPPTVPAHPPAEPPIPVAAPAWRVVHEDRDVLVILKPSGLATQATREAGGALDEQVAMAFPGTRLHHRLDRDASGLVLFTRTRAARVRLQAALAAGELVREYYAVVDRWPAATKLMLDAPIARAVDDPRRRAVRPGGQPALTVVQVERRAVDPTGAPIALVRARLTTGRTHQIRVHLANAGHPILGDPLYAPPPLRQRAPRLALHATRLAWPGGSAEAPLPDELATLLG